MDVKIDHIANWAHTILGTPISLSRSVPSKSLTRPFLFIGGVHGDEPEGVALAKDFLAHLNSLVGTPQFNSFHPWVLIPDINPDGSARNQRVNSQGVDLNRNFPSLDWSSEAKAPRYYPGPSPASELETLAVIRAIDEYNPEVIIHFHSWEPCVVYTGSPGKKWADILGQRSGYESREDIGYPTPGSLGQYGWLNRKTPVICIEEQEKIDTSLTWPRFKSGLIEILELS
jgi:murein peptide amidase A